MDEPGSECCLGQNACMDHYVAALEEAVRELRKTVTEIKKLHVGRVICNVCSEDMPCRTRRLTGD